MDDLNELRAEVRRLHANAVKKVSRLRRANNVDVAGTSFDVRRDVSKVKRYTRSQLQSYAQQLQTFNSRANGFVAGADNTIIPSKEWIAFRAVERRYNARGARHEARVGSIKVPGSGTDIAGRRATLRPNNAVLSGAASSHPFAKSERKPSNIRGVEALRKIKASLETRLERDYPSKQIKRGRFEAVQMMDRINSPHKAKVEALTDYQFSILWNETNFADLQSWQYENVTNGAAERANGFDKVSETYDDDSKALIEWASNLSPEDTKKSPRSGKRRR